MTTAEAFKTVWDHFITKGNPRCVEGSRCAYRNKEGLKCAIGLLIPDDKYDPKMEGVPVNSLKCRFPNIGLDGLDPLFLIDLQHAHDGTISSNGLKNNLEWVARHYRLPIPWSITRKES